MAEGNKDSPVEDQKIGRVSPRILEREMQESYLDYAMSVIVARALPDVRDGLKPVHRRVLYSMWEAGPRSNQQRRKSAKIVGDVLGKYHPHGELAVYDTLVRLAQDFAMRYRLVDGQGNFGSIDGDRAAAMRYTEARLAGIAEELLVDLEKETVEFMPNYDTTTSEPKVLPAKLPNLLLNGTVGIAVGMATNIPPHNLSELVDAASLLIEAPGTTAEELFRKIPGPDFPTGGHIYNQEEIKQAYLSGRGRIVVRGTAEIEEQTGTFRIIITEVPYQVNKAGLVEKIAELVHEKKLEGITNLRDESDRQGIRVVIELGKNAYPKKVLNRLFELTPLQTTFHMNMLALVGGIEPRVFNIKEALEYYLEHRRVVVRKRTEYELKVAKARAHILEGLRIALKQIDEVIAVIKKAESRDDAHQKLVATYKLSAEQATAILEMRLAQLAQLERKRIDDEYAELQKRIAEYEAILKSEKRILGLITKELQELKSKYGDGRRTQIHPEALGEFTAKDLIPDEQVVILLTQDNYIKRMPTSVYRAQGRGGKGVKGVTTKEEDIVAHLLTASTHEDLYVFTDRGRVFRTKVYEVPQASRAAKGQAIVNFVQMAPDEKVTMMFTLREGRRQAGKYFIFATESGVIKKTEVRAYERVRRTGLQAIRLKGDDTLRWVNVSNGADDVFEVTANGNAIRYREEDVRPMGRSAAGVRGMRLKTGDRVVSMDIVARDDKEAEALVILENGFGKKTKLSQFTVHGRGGVGMRVSQISERAGRVVTGQVIRGGAGDVLIISKNGQTIRLALKAVKRLSREAQGVIVMRLNRGDRVASVTVIQEDESAGKTAQTSETASAAGDTPGVKIPDTPGVKEAARKPSPTKPVTVRSGPQLIKHSRLPKPKAKVRQKALKITKSTSKKSGHPKRDFNYWGSSKRKKYY